MSVIPEHRRIIDALFGEQTMAHESRPPIERSEPAVYFVQCGEFIKIGWSETWHARIKNLAVGNPYPIEVLLVLGRPQIFEKTMHAQFASLRHRGEWFRDDPRIREYIESRKDECWHRAGRRK